MSDLTPWLTLIGGIIIALLSGPVTTWIRERASKGRALTESAREDQRQKIESDSAVVRDALLLVSATNQKVESLEEEIATMRENSSAREETFRGEISSLRAEIETLRVLLRAWKGGSWTLYYQLLSAGETPRFDPSSVDEG